jgi:hypothetical protein
MSLKTALINLVSWALPDDPGALVKEAALREAYGQTIDADEDQWRKLTGDANRDLPHLTQSRMQKIAHYLWEQNLLANRLIELPVAFLLAEGVKLQVDDEENQKVLDRFWRDPINDMDLKLPKKARELSMFGEQCYPAFINEIDGMVRLGYLDPSLIETVVMDPDNPEQPIGVVTVKDRKGRARRYRVIINGKEDVFTPRTQAIRESFADGDAFFYRVNELSAGTRGRSDLLAQADWLDAYDQFLFGELDRGVMMRAFLWDVTLKNATPEQVKKRASEISTPKPGSVRVHNDSEEWSVEAPQLGHYEAAAGARLFRNHVLGGATIPEHWFGGGGDVNRAVGAEMETPTLKVYTLRQKTLKHMLESIGRYVLWSAAKVDGNKGEVDWADEKWNVRAILPELSEKDLSKQTAALAQVAAACASLLSQSIVTRKFALQLIALIAGKLGVDVDAEAELVAAEKEADERTKKQRDADNFPPPNIAGAGGSEGERGIQEALELIRDFDERYEARFAELAAGARGGAAVVLREGADPETLETLRGEFAEGLRAARADLEAMGTRLMETLARRPPVERTVTAPDGRQWKLSETPVAGGIEKTVELPGGDKLKLSEEVKP